MSVPLLRRRCAWLIAALPLLATWCEGAETSAAELGLPLIERFLPEDYRGFAQVTSVTVRPDGVVAFGSSAAVYLYDRVGFTRVPLPAAFAMALRCDASGRLWVGGDSTVGTIEEDADDGTPRFVSRMEQLPPAERAIGNVRDFVADRAGRIWAATERGLARFSPDGTARWWPLPTETLPRLALAGDRVVHIGDPSGVSLVEGDQLRALAPATVFPARLTGVVAVDATQALVATLGEGIFHCDLATGAVARRPTPIDALLQAHPPGNLWPLGDGRYAAPANPNGLMIIEPGWTSARIFTKAHGLNTSRVQLVAPDREGGLWVGTNNGLNRLHLAPGVTVFDERSGFPPSSAFALTRHEGRFFAGTFENLYTLTPADPATGEPAHFTPEPRVARSSTTLLSTSAGLIIGLERTYGVLPRTGPLRDIFETGDSAQAVFGSTRDPSIVFGGSERGLHIARLKNGELTRLAVIRPDISWWSIAEDNDGVVWGGTRSSGIVRIVPPADGDWNHAAVTVFPLGTAQLPATHGWTATYRAFGEVAFLADDGTHRWDAAHNVFPLDTRLTLEGRADVRNYPVVTDARGRAWTSPWHGLEACARPLGWFDPARVWHDAPPAAMTAVGYFGAGRMLIESDGREILWAKGNAALVRLDLAALDRIVPPANWQPRLRSVRAAGRARPLSSPAAVVLPFSREPIEFHFSAPRHEPGIGVRFRTRLVGFDAAWSAPDPAPERTFTNLSGGPFVFEVQAVDATGFESGVARYAFSVTPPWQRSPFAVVVYVVLGVTGVAGFVRWRLAQAERERVRLEGIVADRTRDLATARDQAEAASRAKSAFLASMSHELRTPLNGVIGYAQLLQSDARLATDQRERLRIVHQSGEHLLRMINDVLDLAKIEAGKIELRPAPFALAELIGDVAAAHAPAAAAKRLAFHRDLAADLPAWVEGDAQKVRQILDNLIGNAVKFTARGSVTLRVDCAKPAVAFAVIDTGPGIALADREKLFQPFEQARATRPAAPGTGLGLAISRALVEHMGGTLSVASEPGVGSTFSFSLVLPALAPPAAAANRPAVTGYEGERQNVLIVDDQAVNRSLLADLLTPLGFACQETTSGESALARLAAGHEPWPNLAIVDLRMEQMDGLELTRQLRVLARGRALKVLLTSASVISFNPDEARAAGCDDFLPKPFRTSDLVEKIGRLLNLRWIEAAASAAASPATPLPENMRLALREVLAQGDLEAFRAVLARVRAEHPAASARWDALDEAAAGFQLSKLRSLLDQP